MRDKNYHGICWCGHPESDHPHYIPYTGYVCEKCTCGDYAKDEFSR